MALVKLERNGKDVEITAPFGEAGQGAGRKNKVLGIITAEALVAEFPELKGKWNERQMEMSNATIQKLIANSRSSK